MENQLTLQGKIEGEVARQISNLQDRMIAVEYGLFKTDVPDTRFHKIYEKLCALEVSRAKDLEDNAYLRDSVDKKLQATLFTIDGQIKGLDQYKAQYDALIARCEETKTQMEDFMEKRVVQIQHYFRRMDEMSIQINRELETVRDVQLNTKFDIDALQATSTDHGEKLDRLVQEVA